MSVQISRRSFVGTAAGTLASAMLSRGHLTAADLADRRALPESKRGEDVFTYLYRVNGELNGAMYRQILGAANEFKEGDEIVGVAAADEASRRTARLLLSETRLEDLDAHPLLTDELHRLLRRSLNKAAVLKTRKCTLLELREFVLSQPEAAIKEISIGLSSEVIACLVKLMTNQDLIRLGAKIFNPLPGSQIGAKNYLGARIQPNSPTDNTDDIRWQVLNGWAYAVGDVLLGTNPVSSEPESVAAIERTLQDLLVTFEIDHLMPHCVLSHIDVQAEVEKSHPGSTALWFQSIAGSDAANATFDTSVAKMLGYAEDRTGQYGLYFETGQGADFTNGHSHGFDMVIHESRKYGFARALKQQVAESLGRIGSEFQPWVHLNDVAGFIGPEVFRTREQLVRCCLEDIAMGKLHGLCIGLDVCSTLHMDVSLEDLDWCLDQVVPANPAYLMALPTKIDPMLGYLTTGFQDHVRLRQENGYRVNDGMWEFFKQLEVIDRQGRPTEHFGDPLWVYLKYRRRKHDSRSDQEIIEEGREQIKAVEGRGVFIVEGHGAKPSDLEPQTETKIQRIYLDAKRCIWEEFKPSFVATIPKLFPLSTQSEDRTDYVLHPETGERFGAEANKLLSQLRARHHGKFNVQVVVSDGLNALAIMDQGHLLPFLDRLRNGLAKMGLQPAPEHIVLTSGRVRAGYRVGEALFAGLSGRNAILHVIGERPGTGHHTFSIYITAAEGDVWEIPGKVDHDITKVVSGVAVTALPPSTGADETVRILARLMRTSD